MKVIKLSLFVVLVALIAASCGNNKEAEKRIAELEQKVQELSPAPAVSAAQPAAEEKPEGPLPTFEFTETSHDFGTINEGDVVEHTFKFKNTGDAPLIIQNAQGSCGCTVPDWTREPIPVGGEGFVNAKFNSQGKPNAQNKTVTITANTWPKQTRLKIRAMVTPGSTAAPASGPVK